MGLGRYHDKAFTTGCYGASSKECASYVATELLDMTTMKWSDGPNYPFASSICFYSTTQTSEAVYIIGGCGKGGYGMEIVAEFKNDRWSRLRNLNQQRFDHGSISIGDYTLIVGGSSNDSSVK